MNASVRLGVLVASTRCAAGQAEDFTGPAIAAWGAARGWEVTGPVVVPDGTAVGEALRQLIPACSVVITTGGTGFSPDDLTPEETLGVIDREAPGVAEAIRAQGLAATPHASLSRAVAGVAGSTFVVNLPGSLGGVKDGLTVLDGLVDHIVEQLS
jgi:molybdenum cofactor synthesis domain-containing protein